MTEFQSRRELREAERLGLVQKVEQVFDLPTGQITLPNDMDEAIGEQVQQEASQDVAPASAMLTRRRIREMERQGLLDPLTGAVPQIKVAKPEVRNYDEVLAETEEPITSTINLAQVEPVEVEPTDFFHTLAVDVTVKKPRAGLIFASIIVVLAGLGIAAYMLGLFK